MTDSPASIVHPLWVRITHWLNAVAVLAMMPSGWYIYNASPLFDFSFPERITLGGWLAGALLWHFAAMWLLFANGLAYLVLNLTSGRWRRQFLPLGAHAVLADLGAALLGKLSHADLRRYNAVQKLAYLLAIADLVLLVLSGLVLWKPVQFPLLRTLLGDYEAARRVHFAGMSFLLAFFAIHLAMALLFPRTLVAMIRGR